MVKTSRYDLDMIRAKFAAGVTGAALARETGAHHRTIMRIVQGVERSPEATALARRRTGVKCRPRGRLYALTDQDRRNLMEERRAGASYIALGRRYGYDPSAIRVAIKILDPQLCQETARR